MQHTARSIDRIDHSVLLDEPDPEPDAAFAASRFSLGCVTAPAACTPSPARTRARGGWSAQYLVVSKQSDNKVAEGQAHFALAKGAP